MSAPAVPPPSADDIVSLIDMPDCALAIVDDAGRVSWISAAAARSAGVEPQAAAGRALHELLRWSQPEAWRAALAGDGAQHTIELASLGADGGPGCWRVNLRTLPPTTAHARRFAVSLLDLGAQRRLEERLEVAQEFGRIGIWERDVRTFQGRWDRHMFRFWDLEPGDGTPDFAAALRMVPPEDRLDETFRASVQQAGTYSLRFRVRRGDGSFKQLHSQWRVIDGADGRPARALGVMMDDTETWELSRSVESVQLQLRLAIEAARVGLWRHDLRTDRVHYDARAFQILGLPLRPEGMALSEVRSWIHPDDLPAVLASLQRTLATGEPTDAQVRYRHADGRWRYILTRRVLERDATGEPVAFVGVGLDMTEQVERTSQALELAARLDAAARAARVGVWTTTTSTEETDWNEQMYELFDMVGAARPPSLAEWVQHCVHPEDRKRVYHDALAYLFAGDQPLEVELRTIRRDGSSRWVVLRANVDRQRVDRRRIYGVVLDVTEQRAAMDALRRANERAALITRGVGIGTWELDLASGESVWDEQMFLLRGLEPQPQALGAAARMALVHPEDAARLKRLYKRADAQLKPTQFEFRVRLPDGGWRWLASRSTVLPAQDGRGARRIGINWDVTEVRAAEAALRDKLVAQRESEAKSRFLARMSHELRTPLNAVLGFAQLLLHERGDVDGGVRQRRLLHIESAGRHLLSLINDVLDLSSVDSGEMPMTLGAVALDRLLADTLPLVEGLARARGVTLHDAVPPLRVHADATRLRQVMVNLLSNAIKYNRGGGKVRVTAEAVVVDGQSRVRIGVDDTGRGMTPEQVRHVFEPFNRLGADREGIEGTGIGLAIVKALVERMGGQVSVTSRAGVGSRFDVELVAATADEPETRPAPLDSARAAPVAVPPRGGDLLYIEDNPVNVMIVDELVGRRGDLRLRTAPDGGSGVRAARDRAPDLILIDMQLPDFDGHEVLRRLRADPSTAHIPCIALSANAMPEDIERALADGFADYWTKPLDFRAFMNSLDALFGPAG